MDAGLQCTQRSVREPAAKLARADDSLASDVGDMDLLQIALQDFS